MGYLGIDGWGRSLNSMVDQVAKLHPVLAGCGFQTITGRTQSNGNMELSQPKQYFVLKVPS